MPFRFTTQLNGKTRLNSLEDVQHSLAEGSFAGAAENHGFKRVRWCRLWRQQIQDYLIARMQSLLILLSWLVLKPAANIAVAVRTAAVRVEAADLAFWLNLPQAPLWQE